MLCTACSSGPRARVSSEGKYAACQRLRGGGGGVGDRARRERVPDRPVVRPGDPVLGSGVAVPLDPRLHGGVLVLAPLPLLASEQHDRRADGRESPHVERLRLELLEQGERRDGGALRVGEEVHVAVVADELLRLGERVAHDEPHRRRAHGPFLPRGHVADRLDEAVEHALGDVLEPRDEQQRAQQREDRREHDAEDHEEQPDHDERDRADDQSDAVDEEVDRAGEQQRLPREHPGGARA